MVGWIFAGVPLCRLRTRQKRPDLDDLMGRRNVPHLGEHNPENRGTYDPISPGIFATKVIDELMRDRELFPPSFVEHRKQLREVERLEEVQR